MVFISMLSALSEDNANLIEHIYDKYNRLIFAVAINILRNYHDAEEILDNVMISIIENIDKFTHSNENKIKAQIVLYSRNAAINLYKANKRRNQTEISSAYINEDEEFGDIDIEDNDASVEEIVVNQETADILYKYLEKLPIEYQDTIELVYALGYSYTEAAKILRITTNAVGLRLHKAKKKLIQMAGGELGERV